jgi:hypothetical protein
MDSSEQEPPDKIERLREAIEALRQRLEESAKKGKQLSCDTELLLKKTENLSLTNKVSCSDLNWREKMEGMEIGPAGIWIADVKTVDDITFVGEFAARRQLVMTYGNRSFHLEPRRV